MDWFDERYDLGLSIAGHRDLTAYLELVGDGVDGYEDTMFTLEAEMEEFSFFLSAFEFFEDSDSSLVCAALFSSGRDQLDGFVLLSEQSIAFVECFCHVDFDRFEASFGFVHSCLP